MLARSRFPAIPRVYPTKVVDEAAYRLPLTGSRALVVRRALLSVPEWRRGVQFVLHFVVIR